MPTDRLLAAAGRLDEAFPEAWLPEHDGDQVVGYFERLERGNTVRGPAWIVILRSDHDGERAVWLVHTALRNELRRLQPKVGEAVAIRYLGKKRTADDKNEYDGYRVVVDRDPGSNSWELIDDSRATPPPVAVHEPSPAPTAAAPAAVVAPSEPVLPLSQGGPSVHMGPGRCQLCMAEPGQTHATGCPADIPF